MCGSRVLSGVLARSVICGRGCFGRARQAVASVSPQGGLLKLLKCDALLVVLSPIELNNGKPASFRERVMGFA